jgi:ribosomal protein L11 methyltransferase
LVTQTRLHLEAGRGDALIIYAAMEGEFEDDGLPLAMVEIDETTALQEISVYADGDGASVEKRIRRLLAELSLDLPIAREELPNVDWVAKSLEGLAPVRAGRFLVYGSHARAERDGGVIGIEIEAGMAFGTGHHATTCGCLEMIDAIAIRERPRNALDIGTGSAVLAIAIAKLLRIPVLATDVDPTASSVAAANIRKNGVSSLVRTRTASGLRDKVLSASAPFDLIVANILARPLMTMAPDMSRSLTPGGSVILSGILERQRNAVLAAYGTQRFRHVRTLRRQGWVTLHLKR